MTDQKPELPGWVLHSHTANDCNDEFVTFRRPKTPAPKSNAEIGTACVGAYQCVTNENLLDAVDAKIAESEKRIMERIATPKPECTCPSVACKLHGLPPGSASGGW